MTPRSVSIRTFNISIGIGLSISELAMKNMNALNSDLEPIHRGLLGSDIRNSYIETSRSRSKLSFIATKSIDLLKGMKDSNEQ